MLTLIKNGVFTGMQYENYSDDTILFHSGRGEICIKYEKLTYTKDQHGRRIYPKISPEELEDFKAEHRHLNAKILRDSVENSDIIVHGVRWQVDLISRDRMRGVLDTARRNNLPDDRTVPWILADNSVRDTTVKELEDVLDSHTARTGDLFVQYQAWVASGAQDDFRYVAHTD